MLKLSCICPVWKRPLRTYRAIESVAHQEFTGAQTIFMGDGCSHFQKNIDDGLYAPLVAKAAEKGNIILLENLPEHYGGWGYMARNKAIELASGKYLIFYDNDDVILPNHFEHYYQFMVKNPSLGMGYFDTLIEPTNTIRKTYLGNSGIGHSEIIVKTELAKRYYQSDKEYAHDWRFIKKLLDNKIPTKKKSFSKPTYIVKGIGRNREQNID